MQANIMSNPFALGSRPVQSSSFHLAQDGATAGVQNAPASGKLPARLPVVDPVSASSSSNNITLSQQALNSGLDRLGDQTVEAAHRFIGNIAESLFGDAAKGATFHLDTMSVAVDTTSSASRETATDAVAGTEVAALQMNTSAAFIGHGTIATSDGQSFDFAIEVRYAASAQASAGTATGATGNTADNTNIDSAGSAATQQQPRETPDALTLTGMQLPAIAFPGSLADLFKMLGRQLTVSANSGQGNGGDISLRLLRLVNTAALLAPRVRADSFNATPAERNRALASYATPAAPGTVTSA
jgi:hypothetical protein